jgi:hypothetical protein
MGEKVTEIAAFVLPVSEKVVVSAPSEGRDILVVCRDCPIGDAFFNGESTFLTQVIRLLLSVDDAQLFSVTSEIFKRARFLTPVTRGLH